MSPLTAIWTLNVLGTVVILLAAASVARLVWLCFHEDDAKTAKEWRS